MESASYAVIYPKALTHNLTVVRRTVPGKKIFAVIKADAYGHGLLTVANALSDADGFAVADIFEGIKLRQAGITKPILILCGLSRQQDLAPCFQYQLSPVLFSKEATELFLAYQGTEKLSVWLKVEVGMHRLGVEATDVDGLYQRLLACPHVRDIGLLGHLPCADDPSQDTETTAAMAHFQQAVGEKACPTSLANSPTILRFSDAAQDWVRPGLMLYGASPVENVPASTWDLKKAMSFRSRIIALRDLVAGDSIGYGLTYTCDQDKRVAIIGCGYGYGYPRVVRAGTMVWLHDRRVPILGRISMNLMTIDVSSLAQVQVGDEVELWGKHLPVEEVACQADTISYELLCGINQRNRVVSHD